MNKKVIVIGITGAGRISEAMHANLEKNNVELIVVENKEDLEKMQIDEAMLLLEETKVPSADDLIEGIMEEAALRQSMPDIHIEDIIYNKKRKKDYYVPKKIGNVINKAKGKRNGR